MSGNTDNTLIGPELADLLEDHPSLQWCLTLAFHPDTARIGAQCRLPQGALQLGRTDPHFDLDGHPGASSPRGIEHRRISRQAFTLSPRSGAWLLERRPGSSRLRLDGVPVESPQLLSVERLQRGVLLLLGQTVLLHLRLAPALEPAVAAAKPVTSLLGVSASIRRLHGDLQRIAATDDDVLILGPTGCGKDVVARALHALSARAAAPFVAVNMGALNPQLAAAELFGARRGAFTGAHGHREGFFQQAAGGTLFLDEIGDTPPEVQPLLLRAVQSRELQVVGGSVERVTLRLLAATERDPDAPGSSFRAALRHRLAAQELRVSPLAERLEDVGPIAAARLTSLSRERPFSWRDGLIPDPEAQRWAQCFEWLHRYHWPGNVRELLQWTAQIAAASKEGLVLPAAIRSRLAPLLDGTDAVNEPGTETPAEPVVVPLHLLSDEAFITSWERCEFEVARMARAHGCSRQAVYRRLRELDDCRLAGDVPLNELLTVLEACRGDLRETARRLEVSHSGLQTRLRASGVAQDPHRVRPSPGS